jgi:hypothetical protein
MVLSNKALCIALIVVQSNILLAAQQKVSPAVARAHGNAPAATAFTTHSFAQLKHKNTRNFAARPPANLAAELENTKLPAASGKIYSLPGLTRANLLAPRTVHFTEFHNTATPGLNKSKIQSARHPKLTGAQ